MKKIVLNLGFQKLKLDQRELQASFGKLSVPPGKLGVAPGDMCIFFMWHIRLQQLKPKKVRPTYHAILAAKHPSRLSLALLLDHESGGEVELKVCCAFSCPTAAMRRWIH